jgi:tetratricopeptide (TPR) repeat protein
MPEPSKALSGYVKTTNMYLSVMVALAVGFLAGVIFSSYRFSSRLPNQSSSAVAGSMPSVSRNQGETLAALLQATRTTPDNVNAWTQLGDFYFDAGEQEKAIQAYEKSLVLNDKRPDVWTDLGVMYRRAGKPSKAVACFDRALAMNSRHEVALFNKGVVLLHDLKDTKAAMAAWEQLIQVNPDARSPNGQSIKALLEQMKKNNPS